MDFLGASAVNLLERGAGGQVCSSLCTLFVLPANNENAERLHEFDWHVFEKPLLPSMFVGKPPPDPLSGPEPKHRRRRCRRRRCPLCSGRNCLQEEGC